MGEKDINLLKETVKKFNQKLPSGRARRTVAAIKSFMPIKQQPPFSAWLSTGYSRAGLSMRQDQYQKYRHQARYC